jgi:ribonuclease PH
MHHPQQQNQQRGVRVSGKFSAKVINGPTQVIFGVKNAICHWIKSSAAAAATAEVNSLPSSTKTTTNSRLSKTKLSF